MNFKVDDEVLVLVNGTLTKGSVFRVIPNEHLYEVIPEGRRNWEGVLVNEWQLDELNDIATGNPETSEKEVEELSVAFEQGEQPPPRPLTNRPMRIPKYDDDGNLIEPPQEVKPVVVEPAKPTPKPKTTTKKKKTTA